MTSAYTAITEVRTLEKTIQFYAKWNGETEEFRIEALRLGPGSYSARVYVFRKIGPDDGSVWVELSQLPWTKRDTADSVIDQALGFMMELGVATA